MTTILFSNLGYLRGINGCLADHLRYAHRHIFCSRTVQEACLKQVIELIEREQPELCCFVEIDKGTEDLPKFDQLEKLVGERYSFFDIENKYGPASLLRSLPLTRTRSNGFISERQYAYEKIYFSHGTKRLIYKISLEPEVTLFFTHFSLKKNVRVHQLLQMKELLRATTGEVILLGDFNIHSGFGELAPLMHENNLVLLNQEDVPTFRLHTTQLPLDLCVCSPGIARHAQLRIIPQPFSDHEALLLTLNPAIA